MQLSLKSLVHVLNDVSPKRVGGGFRLHELGIIPIEIPMALRPYVLGCMPRMKADRNVERIHSDTLPPNAVSASL